MVYFFSNQRFRGEYIIVINNTNVGVILQGILGLVKNGGTHQSADAHASSALVWRGRRGRGRTVIAVAGHRGRSRTRDRQLGLERALALAAGCCRSRQSSSRGKAILGCQPLSRLREDCALHVQQQQQQRQHACRRCHQHRHFWQHQQRRQRRQRKRCWKRQQQRCWSLREDCALQCGSSGCCCS